jgi:hypothetical protein
MDNIIHTIDLDTNKLNLVRRGEYGHIFLALETGDMPSKYSGAYTTVEYALLAASHYMEDRKNAIQEVKGKIKKAA